MEHEVKQLQQLQGYKHHSFNITKYRNGGESALSVSLKPFLPKNILDSPSSAPVRRMILPMEVWWFLCHCYRFLTPQDPCRVRYMTVCIHIIIYIYTLYPPSEYNWLVVCGNCRYQILSKDVLICLERVGAGLVLNLSGYKEMQWMFKGPDLY